MTWFIGEYSSKGRNMAFRCRGLKSKGGRYDELFVFSSKEGAKAFEFFMSTSLAILLRKLTT